ncbi:MAG: hypothetical protein AB1649_31930, partial [Chloroflexota bacterium]
ANDLREKTLRLIMDQTGIFEYYNPETGAAPARAGGMFSWTASVFIDLAIQATLARGGVLAAGDGGRSYI